MPIKVRAKYNMKNLKSCPFCGGEAQILQRFGVMKYWRIECRDCYCGTGEEESEEEAVAYWNSRVDREAV